MTNKPVKYGIKINMFDRCPKRIPIKMPIFNYYKDSDGN